MEQTLFVDRFSLKTCLRKMSTIIFSAYGIKKPPVGGLKYLNFIVINDCDHRQLSGRVEVVELVRYRLLR